MSGRSRTPSRTTFGIGLSQDHRLVTPFGKRRDDPEALLDRSKLGGDPHLHVVAAPRGRSLGVKRNEVETRAGLASCVAAFMGTMFQKGPQKFGRFRISGPGTVRSANASFRKRPHYRLRSEVIQLEVFVARPLPVANTRLI